MQGIRLCWPTTAVCCGGDPSLVTHRLPPLRLQRLTVVENPQAALLLLCVLGVDHVARLTEQMDQVVHACAAVVIKEVLGK